MQDDLARRFGPGRAAWIAQTLAPLNPESRPTSRVPEEAPLPVSPGFPEIARRAGSWTRGSRVRALPDRWVLMAYRGYDARAHGARPADPRHAECRTGPASAAADGTERRSPRRRSRNAVAGRLRNGGAGRDGAAHPARLRGRSGNRVPPAGGAGREEGRWRCGGRRGGGALRGPALYRLARLRAAGHAVEQHRRGAVRLRGVAAAASHGSPVEARRRATCGWEQPPDHGRRPRGGHRHLRRHRARHGRGADRRPPRQCRALARDVGILPALRRAGRADF